MAKYGSGLTSGQIAMMEKEEIKEALKGNLRVNEGPDGFIYEPCDDKALLDSVIVKAYDALYYQLEEALASGRAMEKVMKNHNFVMPFIEYIAAMEFERKRDYENGEYKYESDLEMEDADENED